MKRSWAVILTAATLAGCRSSQPATNPFLRTTVPPPGTGQGMMVMPGEPAAVPPVVTTPGVPPAVSPAVPVTPVPGQPAPLIAPPPLTPKQEEFHPPGGSYLYHQSSNDRPGADSTRIGAQVTLAQAQVRESSTARVQAASRGAAPPGAVQQAAYHDDQIPLSAGAAQQESSLKFQQNTGGIRGDPPERLATLTAGQAAESGSVRIVGESLSGAASDADSAAGAGVLRMIAGEAVPGPNSSQRDAGGAGSSQVAIVTPSTISRSPAAVERPTGVVTQSAFQPVTKSDYAHTRDYGTLQGRLEYSQSLHQWKLRYIPINGQTDAYGGSVVLSDVPGLKSYAPGDMVAVQGSLAAGSQSPGFSPRYKIHSIQPLSR
jgi:hypothetical protein